MAVLINMDMPKSCADCRFGNQTYRDNRKCVISNNVYSLLLTEDNTPKDCPLKPIKEKCKWIYYDYRTIIPYEHNVDNPFWRIPEERMGALKCPYCGKEIELDGCNN